MSDLIILVAYFGVPVFLLAVACFAGTGIAKRHETLLARRQQEVRHVRSTDLSRLLDARPDGKVPMLVHSEVTLGIDHFRGFLGQLKNICGGEVRSYQSTLDRARREAMLQLSEQAHHLGYNSVANIRVDFADISGNAIASNKASMVSILASGTAYEAETLAQEPLADPLAPPQSAVSASLV